MRHLSGHWNEFSDKMLKVSVIIPTFNEATAIKNCLNQFGLDSEISNSEDQTNKTPILNYLEIIVVDGGSTDATVRIVNSYRAVRCIVLSERGRGYQMNAGALASTGDLLLFLHADTQLPNLWLECIVESIYSRNLAGGRFRFEIANMNRIYLLIACVTKFRSRILGITYGDQAIYTKRETFETLGGYPEIQVFEDTIFANLLKKEGGLDWIDQPILTSARRWENKGVFRTLMLTWFLRLLYTLSISPKILSRFYGIVR